MNFLIQVRIRLVLIALLLFTYKGQLKAQCLISKSSPRGYVVDISLNPDSLIKPSTCPWGYNYNVQISYRVKFSGSNIPSKLNTLNAYLYCGATSSLYYGVPKTDTAGKMTSTGSIWNSNSSCSTATLKSLGCDSFQVQIQGPGIPNQSVGCSWAMPVTFEEIWVEDNGDSVTLHWNTSFEENNQHFIPEVWGPNSTEWVELALVKGAGHSTEIQRYKTAYLPSYEGKYRFRVKQLDFDGTSSWSSIVYHHYYPLGSYNDSIQIYPNPSTGILKFRHLEERDSIRMYDAMGLPVKFSWITAPNEKIQKARLVKEFTGITIVHFRGSNYRIFWQSNSGDE